MLDFVRKSFRRRQLRLVVKALPHLLRTRYTSQDFYTAGQVSTAARQLRLKPVLMISAHAVACAPEEFMAANPDLTEDDYRHVRTEIADLFWLDEAKLNCRTLTSKFRNPVGRAMSLDMVGSGHAGLDGSSSGGNGGGGGD